ncbi:MAG: ATP-binding protein [Planctomycetes bacterium]|nr:ATP-binding protein [Planctomycetota bacterium]
MSWLRRFFFGDRSPLHTLLVQHFHPHRLSSLAVHERSFPLRVKADLQRALDSVMNNAAVSHFSGVQLLQFTPGLGGFASILTDQSTNCAALITAPQYEEVDVGESEPVRQLKDGIWLMNEECRFAVMLVPPDMYCYNQSPTMRIQVAVPREMQANGIVQSFFDRLESAVRAGRSYRGKVLSLEQATDYTGRYTGIKVHKLHSVARENVILPRATLELLDRNVIRFVTQRPQLAKLGMSTKKGILFYGLPGTGKTYTIHYLASALPEITTLLITEEQINLLSDYMALARLLQPSMVVIEDADLIARDRTATAGPGQEMFLNKLLNEMDGLRPDADILFILTTNRPETLEAALTSRPGRIDQAIEFPLPDEAGREKLIRLYAKEAPITDNIVQATIKLTENVSAAFIKELMRRATQFYLERGGTETILLHDVDAAMEEMMFEGGSLNRKLLGGHQESEE